ncbi:MAG: glyceraldehyde 3-phosphate dehydrogenase [Parcubacteria group bacterium Gr01-1014_3]|nr:MAG: glyceraldehyde 3-phosphate dehydrogenase [Parcubacteria group bacterium Gr01-1014_3]
MTRIAINGFGRIGRLFFRQMFGKKGFEIVAINDLGDIDNLAYLLKYDSVYRTYDQEVKVERHGEEGYLVVGNPSASSGQRKIKVIQEKELNMLPWRDLKIDIVVESTGAFESFGLASGHLTAGARRVVITAPAKDAERDDAKTVLMGINEEAFKFCKITSNGSCTTNATHPVIAIMSENPGVKKAMLATVHGYTATQNLVDGPTKGKDYRRGRAAAVNISPSFTGAAISVTRPIPELEGKFDGLAYRVPIVAGSLADITFVASRKTTVEEVNEIFRKAAKSAQWKNILKIAEDQIVSSDVIGEPYGAVVDLTYTRVVDGDLVKVLSWYDNEFGYVATLMQHVEKAAEYL